MPTNTDLVTDLPADFAVFGQGVDTTMADLKGGTTGQILSKTSATDMDFTWITNDVGDITAVTVSSPITGGGTSGSVNIAIQDASTSQKGSVQLSDSTSTTSSILASTPTATKSAYDLANTANTTANAAVAKSTVTAKGSIFTATASATPAQIAVGNNGEVLLADSSTSSGLRYQGSMAGGKNTIINGGMDIWQRGTASQTPSNGSQMNVDRFYFTGAAGVVLTQDTDVPTSPYFQYSLKTVDAANYGFSMGQKIEAANSVLYAGQTVTVSFWAKTTSGTATMIVNAYYPSAKDNFASLTLIASNSMNTPTSTWTRFSTQFTLPSNVQNGLMILIGRGATTNTSFYTGVQLELGSVATSFQRAGGTIQGELAACKRYLPSIDNSSGSGIAFVSGYAYSTNGSIFTVPLDVQARVQPTGVTVSGTISAYALNTPTAMTPTFDTAAVTSVGLLASHTITAGQGARLGITAGAKLLFTGCEL